MPSISISHAPAVDAWITPPSSPQVQLIPASTVSPIPIMTHFAHPESSQRSGLHQVRPPFPYQIDEDNEVIINIPDQRLHPRGCTVIDSAGTRKVVRLAELPQTVEFHQDFMLEKLAYDLNSDTVTKIVRKMMFIRNNSAAAVLTHRSSSSDLQKLAPPCSTQALRLPDGSYDPRTSWDHYLADARRAGKIISQRRQSKSQELWTVAEWCLWARDRYIQERGEFVQDLDNGIELIRRLQPPDPKPGVVTRAQGRSSVADAQGKTWEVKLGYRRSVCDGQTSPPSPWDDTVRTDFDQHVIAWYEQSVLDRSLESMRKVEKGGVVREERQRRGRPKAQLKAA